MRAAPKTRFIPLPWALLLAAVPAVIILFLRLAVLRPIIIESHSMEPTLYPGERVALLDLHLWSYHPRRGDVVAVSDPFSRGTALVKRVIALPNEVVQIANGAVYINNQPLQEPYLAAPVPYEYPQILIPSNSLFLLGDNRKSSEDSSAWGPVPVRNVIGRVVAIYWPPVRSGRVK